MSYKTIIEIEGIERELLNFSINCFIPNLWLTINKDTIHWTMEDYREIPLANKLSAKGKEPFGGLLNIVMKSTSDDDFIL